MEYLLEHYRHTAGVRIFIFNGVSPDHSHSQFTVSVDTALLRRYTISLQELPLLCRRFLENRAIAGGSRSLTFAEADMAHLATERETLNAANKRKFGGRPWLAGSHNRAGANIKGQDPDTRTRWGTGSPA